MGSPRKALPPEQAYTLGAVNRTIESLIGVINHNAELLAGAAVTSGSSVVISNPGDVIVPVVQVTKEALCDVEMQAWLWRDRP